VADEHSSSGTERGARAVVNPSAQLPWRQTLRSRLFAGAVLFAVWTAGIQARLVYLQVIEHSDMKARADRQHLRTIAAPAKRGEILDRNGHVLAYSVDADTIFADPSEVENPDTMAQLVCTALDDCGPRERQEMAQNLRRDSQFVYLARKVSPDEAQRVKALNLKGIAFLKESRRYYPKKELASHLLGYVGTDNDGLAGVEDAYDARIKGQAGTILIQTDAKRKAFSRVERRPTAGATLELTIDEYLQFIAERELRVGVEENRASGGSAVVMDPRTGEILALANEPSFNPNTFRTALEMTRRNRAVQDLYEPGSAFKIITASAALEERIIAPSDWIDTSGGQFRIGSRVVHDVHRYGPLSFTDVIVKSSNVGAIRVGLRLGPERLSRYIGRFGFGGRISPDFRSENPGIVWDPTKLNDSALASVSMGYQVGVTPLQMTAAVSAIANGGELMEPRIVRAFIKDDVRTEVKPKVLRRSITRETAEQLTTILEEVVERGTARAAKIEGHTIAGKTGTARKLIEGRYSQADYNSSFVGFVPSRNPALAIVVVIDSPHAVGYYGGTVAAPVFKRIAELSLRHLGHGRTIDPTPPVMVAIRAEPVEHAAAPVSSPAIVTIEGPVQSDLLPDLRGMSARDALRILTKVGMTGRLSGSGFVIEQEPPPGSPIERGGSCQLILDRTPRPPPAGLQP
jgi:cell division protein FtsI (penicillin-binding protein 3)